MGRARNERRARMGCVRLRYRGGVAGCGDLFGSVGAQNRDVVRSPSGSLTLALFPKKRMGDMQIFWRRDFDVF